MKVQVELTREERKKLLLFAYMYVRISFSVGGISGFPPRSEGNNIAYDWLRYRGIDRSFDYTV